jgi:hypothetical protein
MSCDINAADCLDTSGCSSADITPTTDGTLKNQRKILGKQELSKIDLIPNYWNAANLENCPIAIC